MLSSKWFVSCRRTYVSCLWPFQEIPLFQNVLSSSAFLPCFARSIYMRVIFFFWVVSLPSANSECKDVLLPFQFYVLFSWLTLEQARKESYFEGQDKIIVLIVAVMRYYWIISWSIWHPHHLTNDVKIFKLREHVKKHIWFCVESTFGSQTL